MTNKADSRKSDKVSIPITGMTCTTCAATVEKGLSQTYGVEEAKVHFASEKASIEYDPNRVDLAKIKDTVSQLRNQIRSGGYMLIDDGYLRETKRLHRKGYEHYKDHETTISELTAFNDLLLKEINTTRVSEKINNEYIRFIEKRGRELIAGNPELSHTVSAYVQLQKEECKVIHDHIDGALWLLQKRT